jgi:hypothetical protein
MLINAISLCFANIPWLSMFFHDRLIYKLLWIFHWIVIHNIFDNIILKTQNFILLQFDLISRSVDYIVISELDANGKYAKKIENDKINSYTHIRHKICHGKPFQEKTHL